MNYKVLEFKYNGFCVNHTKKLTTYKVVKFINWTTDPGVGIFLCSDKKERALPTCVILDLDYKELPEQKKTGVVFGMPSTSK